jgi:hypothetical protein
MPMNSHLISLSITPFSFPTQKFSQHVIWGQYSKFYFAFQLKTVLQIRPVGQPDLPAVKINSELPLKSGKLQLPSIRLWIIAAMLMKARKPNNQFIMADPKILYLPFFI